MFCRFLRFLPSLCVRGRFVTIALRRGFASSAPSEEGPAGLHPPSSLALIGIYGFQGLYLSHNWYSRRFGHSDVVEVLSMQYREYQLNYDK